MKFTIRNRETEGKNESKDSGLFDRFKKRELELKQNSSEIKSMIFNPFKKNVEEVPVKADDAKKHQFLDPFKKTDDKYKPSKKQDEKVVFGERRKKKKLKREIVKRTRNTILTIVECSIVFLSLILGMKDVVANFLNKQRIMTDFADFLDSFSLNGIELGFRCFFIANLIIALLCLIIKPLRSFKIVLISIVYIVAFTLIMYYFSFN